ncbi:hypothetical protein LCGC14_2079070 [marine sediment metagenome]|uniref:Uncharacterized protein n=1 Tax=marine sediment metagenome TaxID=412755 RepID=A0A0F9GUI4_9ZZZZ
MQLKKLTKIQMGSRLIECPVCKKLTAGVETKTTSAGITRRKVVCHASNCRSEREV